GVVPMVTGSEAVGPGLGLGAVLLSSVPGVPFRKLWNVTVESVGSPVTDSWLPRVAGPGAGAVNFSSCAVILMTRSPTKPRLLIEVSLLVSNAGVTAVRALDVEKLTWMLKSPRGSDTVMLPGSLLRSPDPLSVTTLFATVVVPSNSSIVSEKTVAG